MVREWESLNAKAELARMHRDGHCLEAVMLYVHHSRWRELPKGDVPRTVHKRGFTRISRAGNPKRKRPNCQSRVRLLKQRHRCETPRSRGVGRPAYYLPSGTVGQWLPAPCNGGPSARAATRKQTRRGRLGPRAGIPKRRDLTAKQGRLLHQRYCSKMPRSRGVGTPSGQAR